MDVTELMTMKKEEDIFDILKTQSLSIFYKALPYLELADLNNDEFNAQLKKSFYQNVIIRTESYVCTMTVGDKDTVKNMKRNWETFVERIKQDEDWSNIKKELERLWTIFELVFPEKKQMKDENSKKDGSKIEEEDKVETAVKWFTKSPVELFDGDKMDKQDHLNKIQEALDKSNLNSFLVNFMPKFIYEAIEMLDRDFSKWKKKLYIFEDGKKDVCYVAFYLNDVSGGTYYVDQYGNFYLKETNLLETLRKFYGYYHFIAPAEKNYDVSDDTTSDLVKGKTDVDTVSDDCDDTSECSCGCYDTKDYYVQLLCDDEFLDMLLQSFFRLRKATAFLYFRIKHDGKDEEKIEYLKKLKLIVPFFGLLNDNFDNVFSTTSRNSNTSRGCKFFWYNQVKKSKKLLVIKIKSYHFVDGCNWLIKNFGKLETMLRDASLKNLCYDTSYMEIVQHVMVPQGKAPYMPLLTTYKNKIENIFKAETETFVNFYHYVAAEIFDFYKAANTYDDNHKWKEVHFFRLKWEELKFLVLWVAEKFKSVNITSLHEMKQYFEENEEDIKNEVCRLIQIAIDCDHQFSNKFAAVYYFCKHYSSISKSLQGYVKDDEFKKDFNLIETLPKFTAQNETKCAKFYFKLLPRVIFNPKNRKVNSENENSSTERFEKYSIVGIKYTLRNGKPCISNLYLPPNEAVTNSFNIPPNETDITPESDIDSAYGTEAESDYE